MGSGTSQRKASNDVRNAAKHDTEEPDAPICSDFLLSKCEKGVNCQMHHCPLPFGWQFERGGEWINFTNSDNEELEKLYCNKDLEQCILKDVQLPVESESSGVDITILLDGKILFIDNPSDREVHLRRLSTVSYAVDPHNNTATQWIWYWKDGDIWKKYDVDDGGRDLQQCLEKAFLRKLHGFRFCIAGQEYRMKFDPESDMTQTNVTFNTRRSVRRRPKEFVCRGDMQVMGRSIGLPAHWSSMSSHVQRVQLSPSSNEFEDVEELFTKSISKRVKIVKIERVQNPFMWEKYQRKKDHMLAQSKEDTNEKTLFHGTSPDAVEAICKQNFDWRVHGKNATTYGQGSYFALNSSYSDSYASQDDNSSQFMFVAKVLVGSYTKGQSSYRRPPAKDPSNPASELYDSCVDNEGSPSIFVIFDKDQFYPEYIVEYFVPGQAYCGK